MIGSPRAAASTSPWRPLFERAPVAMALLDLAGGVVDCNPAFLDLCGLGREKIVGRPFVARIEARDREEVERQLRRVAMGARPAIRVDGVGVRAADQHLPPVSIHIGGIDGEGGGISRIIVYMLGVGGHHSWEAQLAQAQKMQALGQLAGGIAHDFNNLLTAMLGHCDLLIGRHGPQDPSFEDINELRQNAVRASNLVRQLLAYTRKQALQPVLLDVNQALAELSSMLGRLLGETIELRLELCTEIGKVRVDPGQFDQVIVNLAVNARDAMPDGGSLVLSTGEVDLGEPLVHGAEIMPPGRYVVIVVRDSGCGIAPEVLGDIFEPFFSTKEVGAGTGLGLATVYGIIRQTGGFVTVDSEPGRGAAFRIHLPAHQPGDGGDGVAAEQGALAAAEVPAAGAGGGTVLLVEDEDAVRSFAVRALAGRGYRVLEAESGEQALTMIDGEAATIDLLVSDVVMPGVDGYQLAREVRQKVPSANIILMSGYAEEALGADLEADSAVHFLAKPFTLAELAAKVGQVLAAG